MVDCYDRCRNCVCLIEGVNGEWACEEYNKNIEEITECLEANEE